jgi:hypothetical protein
MRYFLDLDDGGPLVECDSASQASNLGSLWRTAKWQRDPDYERLIAVKIRAIAVVDRGPVTPWMA